MCPIVNWSNLKALQNRLEERGLFRLKKGFVGLGNELENNGSNLAKDSKAELTQ